ncbi:MAG: cupin domain-containing protein [Ardenticatenaceae bacterium]|nr:cupin domain-containing protein [Ardenticatenaceae bacterium]
MIHQTPDRQVAKGWFVGPWNSGVPVAVGYANAGVNEPHHHAQMFEIYLVASGTSTAVVNQQSIQLQPGDMLVVEPGEPHTFTHNSEDYYHFVIQTPFAPGDKIND